jgi:hypothetical protein
LQARYQLSSYRCCLVEDNGGQADVVSTEGLDGEQHVVDTTKSSTAYHDNGQLEPFDQVNDISMCRNGNADSTSPLDQHEGMACGQSAKGRHDPS